MPTLLCPNGHTSHYRNTRGSRAQRPCPDCGETMRSPTAYQCKLRGTYEVSAFSFESHTMSRRAYRGACDLPKGHGGPHMRGNDLLALA